MPFLLLKSWCLVLKSSSLVTSHNWSLNKLMFTVKTIPRVLVPSLLKSIAATAPSVPLTYSSSRPHPTLPLGHKKTFERRLIQRLFLYRFKFLIYSALFNCSGSKISLSTKMRPQYSQTIIFLRLAMSI